MQHKEPFNAFEPFTQPTAEPSARWVRVKVGDTLLADSKEPMLLIQYGPGALPTYFFPAESVNMALLTNPKAKANKQYWVVETDGQQIPKAAWAYITPPDGLADLNEHITFTWGHEAITWFEEAEQVFAHARDPHKRVDAIASSRHVQVVVEGQIVAETKRPILLFETWLPTRYYIPPEDVNMGWLRPSDTRSLCPYKGRARYWSITVGDKTLKDVVWSYPEPIAENPKIKGLLAFFNEKVDLVVDGVLQEKPATPWS